MKHPTQWRKTIDPFSLPYRAFQPTEILGYPHAGNDVFHAKGIYNGKVVRAYIKVARQKGAAVENEVALLSQLHSPVYPTVIDYGFDGTPFSVTLELPGDRLSVIVGENERLESLAYMEEYGATLAKLHASHYPDIRYGFKLSMNNIGHENRIYTFPYFCAFLLKRFLASFQPEEQQ